MFFTEPPADLQNNGLVWHHTETEVKWRENHNRGEWGNNPIGEVGSQYGGRKIWRISCKGEYQPILHGKGIVRERGTEGGGIVCCLSLYVCLGMCVYVCVKA